MKTIKNSIKAFIKNPEIIFIFIALYVVITLFNKIPSLPSPSAITDLIYKISSKLILALIFSFFLSIFIGASYLSLKNKFSFKKSIKYYKFTFLTFIFILPVLIVSYLSTNYLFPFLEFSAWLSMILNEFLFVIISALSLSFIMKQIINSKMKLKNYILTLLVFVLYYPLTYLLDKFIGLFPDNTQLLIYIILYFIIIYPIITLILTSLFENVSSK